MRKFDLSSSLEYEISLVDNIQEELQSFININPELFTTQYLN